MDSELFVEILADKLIIFGCSKFNSDYILHQDNDPKHFSRYTMNFLEINNIVWVIIFKINEASLINIKICKISLSLHRTHQI